MAAAATSVIVLDRTNNTTCTINLHGNYQRRLDGGAQIRRDF